MNARRSTRLHPRASSRQALKAQRSKGHPPRPGPLGNKNSQLATRISKPIHIVGCGPGAREYLTFAGQAAIEKAQVLVGVNRLLEVFSRHGAKKIRVDGRMTEALEEMAKVGRKRIAVLVTGDPGLFSFAERVLRRFGRKACRVIPGISSVQTAFARLGVDWQDARVISAHYENPEQPIRQFKREKKIAVLSGGEKTRRWVTSLGMALEKTHQIIFCENLTLPGERIRKITPTRLKKIPHPGRAVFLFIQKKEIL